MCEFTVTHASESWRREMVVLTVLAQGKRELLDGREAGHDDGSGVRE